MSGVTLVAWVLLVVACAGSEQDAARVGAAEPADPSSVCPEQIAAGADLGIFAVPDAVEASYGAIFCKYTEVLAPNGKPIRIFAQREISNEQLVYARGVLEFFLEDVPGSRYGADKGPLADRMADNSATLLMMRGRDGEYDIFDSPLWDDIDGQPLYEDETVTTGSGWFVDNVYDGHRDASLEEILHLVHDTGIGIDVDGMPAGVVPGYQREIRRAQINALETQRLWGQPERAADWIEELRQEGSLTQEYLAAAVDTYFGLWGAWQERPGGMWGLYVAKTREEMSELDPMGYALMARFFHPHLSYDARVDPAFTGTFQMQFDPAVPYTHKSRYLANVTLTGELDTGILGNGLDNRLTGNAGDNIIECGPGVDTVVFQGILADYDIERTGSVAVVADIVAGRDGTDTVRSFERLAFRDMIIDIEAMAESPGLR